MNVSEKQLEDRYSDLETEDLLELVARGGLTEDAFRIVKAELEKRGETEPVLPDVSFEAAESAKLQIQVSLSKRFWRGEVPLRYAFWVGAFLPSRLLDYFVTQDMLGFVGTIVALCATILVAVGVLRSAIKYKGRRAWAVASILYVVLYIVFPVLSLESLNQSLFK